MTTTATTSTALPWSSTGSTLRPASTVIEQDRRHQEEFRVLLGRQWTNGWLAFETRGEKRRLAPIPSGWEDMTPEALESPLKEATLVQPSRRLVE